VVGAAVQFILRFSAAVEVGAAVEFLIKSSAIVVCFVTNAVVDVLVVFGVALMTELLKVKIRAAHRMERDMRIICVI